MDQHITNTTFKFKRKIETLVDLAITKEDLAVAYTKILKEALPKIITDVMTGKFGTKNRAELISRLEGLYLELSDNKPKQKKS